MAAVVVTAANTNTRVNDADTATNWGHWGGGGAAPTAEAQLKYQGSNAVNKKNTSTTGLVGLDYDPGSGALDMTAAANKLWLAKVYIADFGALNTTTGVTLGIGSANNAYYDYVIAGSSAVKSVFSAYPAQGGYIIVALDPNISSWRNSTVGSPDLTAVDWFGTQAQFATGAAKAENQAIDALDVGTGLQLYGGDGVSADGSFEDFVTADQGTVSNRWGYVTKVSGAIIVRGMLQIGINNTTPTATEFTDSTSIVVFPDGYHSSGAFGVTFDLGSASTVITLSNQFTGLGAATPVDTRPDFRANNTSGSLTFSGSLTNFNVVHVNSACHILNATIECLTFTPGDVHLHDTTLVSLVNVSNGSFMINPLFGTSSGLHDCEIKSKNGLGHAILNTVTTTHSHTLTNVTFTGYGADGTGNAAIRAAPASGQTITYNIIGGSTPTVYNLGAGTVTVVVNPVTLTITVRDLETNNLITSQDVNVLIEAASGGGLGVGTDIIKGFTNASGQITDTRTYSVDQPITGWARKSSGSPYYVQANISGTISKDNGLSLTVLMAKDE